MEAEPTETFPYHPTEFHALHKDTPLAARLREKQSSCSQSLSLGTPDVSKCWCRLRVAQSQPCIAKFKTMKLERKTIKNMFQLYKNACTYQNMRKLLVSNSGHSQILAETPGGPVAALQHRQVQKKDVVKKNHQEYSQTCLRKSKYAQITGLKQQILPNVSIDSDWPSRSLAASPSSKNEVMKGTKVKPCF